MNEKKSKNGMKRRDFMKSSAAVGAGLVFAPMITAQAQQGSSDDLNIALLGGGAQGQVLMNACLKIKGVRFKAVCDIWEKFNLNRIARRLKAYKHDVNTYIDYKEMLEKEKDLDAVLIATPDFWHADHTVDSLKAGLNVYCEKEMSNTLEGAKRMVKAAKETGKLLQIGHQRRSNPRYLHCYNNLITQARILGRITTVNGQWNRGRNSCEFAGYPNRYKIEADVLKKFGYESMEQFRNWRWFKAYGGGPIVDLGSHQIDIYNWFLQAQPKSVMASGGLDYWTDKSEGRQWYDTVQALFVYETDKGPVRAFYQTITTNSSNGYFETFMGDEGTLVISEAAGRGDLYHELGAPDWEKWVSLGIIEKPKAETYKPEKDAVLDVRETVAPPKYNLPVEMKDPYHKPHLENFFNAIKGKEKLNCPAEVGYESAATVLKVNEAVEAGKSLEYKPEEFKV